MTPLTRKQFHEFLDTIPDSIISAKKILEKNTLDYSFEEVNSVERIYKKYRKRPHRIGLSKNELDTIFVAYIGTAVLWHFGGYWLYANTNQPKGYGIPFIADSRGKEGQGSPAFSPEHWRYFIDTKQMDESIANMFSRWQRYHDIHPEYVLKPVKNIN